MGREATGDANGYVQTLLSRDNYEASGCCWLHPNVVKIIQTLLIVIMR